MKILVTGFDPFDREKINPAYEAVKLLPAKICDADKRAHGKYEPWRRFVSQQIKVVEAVIDDKVRNLISYLDQQIQYKVTERFPLHVPVVMKHSGYKHESGNMECVNKERQHAAERRVSFNRI
jgi:hypothetical protein